MEAAANRASRLSLPSSAPFRLAPGVSGQAVRPGDFARTTPGVSYMARTRNRGWPADRPVASALPLETTLSDSRASLGRRVPPSELVCDTYRVNHEYCSAALMKISSLSRKRADMKSTRQLMTNDIDQLRFDPKNQIGPTHLYQTSYRNPTRSS